MFQRREEEGKMEEKKNIVEDTYGQWDLCISPMCTCVMGGTLLLDVVIMLHFLCNDVSIG